MINAYQITEKQIVGEVYETVANYDLLSAVMICIGTKEDERYTGLLKLLDIWLSGNSIDEKRAAFAGIMTQLLAKPIHISASRYLRDAGESCIPIPQILKS